VEKKRKLQTKQDRLKTYIRDARRCNCNCENHEPKRTIASNVAGDLTNQQTTSENEAKRNQNGAVAVLQNCTYVSAFTVQKSMRNTAFQLLTTTNSHFTNCMYQTKEHAHAVCWVGGK
jgi:hypothetical protein